MHSTVPHRGKNPAQLEILKPVTTSGLRHANLPPAVRGDCFEIFHPFELTANAKINPKRPKHPSSREKIVELGDGPNATAFITAEGARLCPLYFHSQGLWSLGNKDCNFSLCLFIDTCFFFCGLFASHLIS